MTTRPFSQGLLSFVFLISLVTACGPKIPPRISVSGDESKQVLDELRGVLKSLQKIQSAKGYAKVRLKVKGRAGNFEEAIFIRLPSSFRFETVDDLGNTRFLLLSDGASLFWRDFSRKEEETQEFSEEKMRKYLPLAADLEETLGLFMGRLPPDDLSSARVFKEGVSGNYGVLSSRKEYLWNPETKVILSFAFREENGKVAFRYEAGDFQGLIPRRISLKDYKTRNEVQIRYLDFELNPVIPGDRFEKEFSSE